MNYINTLKAKIDCWYNYGELLDVCNKISKSVSDKVIINNIETNTVANPKSALNMLNLGLKTGDKIEIIILAKSESTYKTTLRTLKDIFDNHISFIT